MVVTGQTVQGDPLVHVFLKESPESAAPTELSFPIAPPTSLAQVNRKDNNEIKLLRSRLAKMATKVQLLSAELKQEKVRTVCHLFLAQ